MGEVDHIRRKSAAGAHVDFQRNQFALFPNVLVSIQAEELKMHKPAGYAEAFHRSTAESARVLGQFLQNVIYRFIVIIHTVHDGANRDVAGFKDRLAP